jgi:hypothetical protein
MVLDAVIGGRDYEGLEAELITDWRTHYANEFQKLKPLADRALQAALGRETPPADAEALAELRQLEQRLAAA